MAAQGVCRAGNRTCHWCARTRASVVIDPEPLPVFRQGLTETGYDEGHVAVEFSALAPVEAM